jgi:hypothetical protein
MPLRREFGPQFGPPTSPMGQTPLAHITQKPGDLQALLERARQDSNLRPLAPEVGGRIGGISSRGAVFGVFSIGAGPWELPYFADLGRGFRPVDETLPRFVPAALRLDAATRIA